MVAANARRAKTRNAKPKVTQAKAQPRAEAPTDRPKSIFLFADGTGNSSAKLFKTNVWRMYEAIDFGGASPAGKVQIGYYDNGVGTSTFRPLALLGGVFGFGLKNNVLRLYTFLCRNYRPGDRIYMFGFSRGAFTIRLLADLVATEGILQPREGDPKRNRDRSYQVRESSLASQVRNTYRDYRRNFKPNLPSGKRLVKWGRFVRDEILGFAHMNAVTWNRLWRRPQLVRAQRCYADIEFVGVWDTVAAYGGPFAEFTRGIDDWLYPLTMPDYFLSPRVRKARHALSLDDERDAFWPLLWDEVHEDELITSGGEVVVGRDEDGEPIKERRTIAQDRLRQVWFAGVHSDVGGGYPDESLSYIPLLWMMDELGKDVDLLEEFVQRARDLANPYGPIHDSRAGPAAYYRYQPRKIAAFIAPPCDGTKSLRQLLENGWPDWKALLGFFRRRTSLDRTASLRQPGARGEPDWKGLLRSACIHESVLARIISGIDNYAPAALPAQFDIVRAPPRGRAIRSLTPANLEALKKTKEQEDVRFDHQEEAWDLVWWRRLIYFLTIGATILVVIAPASKWLQAVDKLCSDDRCFARSFLDVALFFVPQSIRNSLNPWTSVPLAVIALAIVILALIAWGRRTERNFRDSVREIWRAYLGQSGVRLAAIETRDRSSLRPVRESLAYQGGIFVLKWNLLPAACGLATILALLYAAVIALSQLTYAIAEPGTRLCKPAWPAGVADKIKNVPFSTKAFCTDLGIDVYKDTPYRLTVEAIPVDAKSPWYDATIPADPRRGVTRPRILMIAAAPLKRVTSANWLQVITEVRDPKADNWGRRLTHPGFGVDLRKQELTFVNNQRYETIFCPRWNGRLYLMVNDAAPLLWHYFYNNNRGAAWVSVEPAPEKHCTHS